MKMVNTVLGQVSPTDLGPTLMHEHMVSSLGAGHFVDETVAPFDRAACVEAAVETMAELKTYGVRTFVDATPIDLGRDAGLLKEISEKSGMNIVCSTGLYYEKDGAAAYYRIRSTVLSRDISREMEELYAREITEGIGGTGVKAGVLKVATGHAAITPYEESALKAAARTQKVTGVPIITHTEGGTMGPEQVDLLVSEGADPKQIMVGHACGNGDMRYHTSVLDKGAYVSFDRIGLDLPLHRSDRWTLACIVGLIGIGFAHRITMSHDSLVAWLGRPTAHLFVQPNWHPRRIFRHMIPALKKAGVTDEQIRTMLVENPRRLFAGENDAG
jgi:phosphotriesterase-related protein